MKTVLCSNCEDRIPEYEALPIGDKWACSDECKRRLENDCRPDSEDSGDGAGASL